MDLVPGKQPWFDLKDAAGNKLKPAPANAAAPVAKGDTIAFLRKARES